MSPWCGYKIHSLLQKSALVGGWVFVITLWLVRIPVFLISCALHGWSWLVRLVSEVELCHLDWYQGIELWVSPLITLINWNAGKCSSVLGGKAGVKVRVPASVVQGRPNMPPKRKYFYN